MAETKLGPLSTQVPIVDPDTGNPTPYFQQLMQIFIDEKNAVADDVIENLADVEAAIAVVQGEVDDLESVVAALELDDLADVDTTGVSDGDVLTYDNGASEWIAAAPTGGGGGSSYERTRVIPVIADFTLQNAGTAAITDTTYGIRVNAPSVGTQIRFAKQNAAVPATPYTIISRSQPVLPHQGASYFNCLILRNSSNGRLIISGSYNGVQYLVQSWSSYTGFNANILGPQTWAHLPAVQWQKIENDGTNLKWFVSPDGNTWEQVSNTTLATYLTAAGGTLDEIGFGVMVNGTTAQCIQQSYEVV